MRTDHRLATEDTDNTFKHELMAELAKQCKEYFGSVIKTLESRIFPEAAQRNIRPRTLSFGATESSRRTSPKLTKVYQGHMAFDSCNRGLLTTESEGEVGPCPLSPARHPRISWTLAQHPQDR